MSSPILDYSDQYRHLDRNEKFKNRWRSVVQMAKLGIQNSPSTLFLTFPIMIYQFNSLISIRTPDYLASAVILNRDQILIIAPLLLADMNQSLYKYTESEPALQ